MTAINPKWLTLPPSVIPLAQLPPSDDNPGDNPIATLTPRQLAYLRCVAARETGEEIAERFGITASTVKNTLSSAYKRLGLDESTGMKAGPACYLLGRYDREGEP